MTDDIFVPVLRLLLGFWRAWGSRGRRFESSQPDWRQSPVFTLRSPILGSRVKPRRSLIYPDSKPVCYPRGPLSNARSKTELFTCPKTGRRRARTYVPSDLRSHYKSSSISHGVYNIDTRDEIDTKHRHLIVEFEALREGAEGQRLPRAVPVGVGRVKFVTARCR